MTKYITILLLSASSVFAHDCEITNSVEDVWPPIVETSWAPVEAAITEYHRIGQNWRDFAREVYRPSGDYLNWSAAGTNGKPDTNGVIVVTYNGGKTWVHNPVSIAQDCLRHHSFHMKGQPLDPRFKVQADFLLTMQGEDGAIRYQFPYSSLAPGWVSAMAQGQAISVWTRAYKLFGDTNYLTAAEKSYRFMLTPASEGGTLGDLSGLHPSLSRYKMLKEYPLMPDVYVLNGSIFALFGIYDWSEFDPSAMCELRKLAGTIKRVLPYYFGSSYNLTHQLNPGANLSISAAYLRINMMCAWNLAQIVPDIGIDEWKKWAEMLSQPLNDVTLTVEQIGNDVHVSSIGLDRTKIQRAPTLDGPWVDATESVINPSVIMTNLSPVGFFRAVRPIPMIESFTRNGSFSRWPMNWTPVTSGGSLQIESLVVDRGQYLRMDVATNAWVGVWQNILSAGGNYRVDFWVRASKPNVPVYVYFGTSGANVLTHTASDRWALVSVKAKAIGPTLAIFTRTPGTVVYLDDVFLWDEGGN